MSSPRVCFEPGLCGLATLIIIVFLLLHLCGCAGGAAMTTMSHTTELPRPWLPLLESCVVADGEACCPATDISAAMSGCASLRGEALRCKEMINECRAVSEIDLQIADNALRASEARAAKLGSQRWWFAGGGVLAGIVGTALLLFVAR